MKSLIPGVALSDDDAKALLAEFKEQNLLTELHEALDGRLEPSQPLGKRKGRRPTRRVNSQVQFRDAKICSIAEDLSIEEYAQKADRLQPPLVPRQSWRNKGCPASYVMAVADSDWRKQVADERGNAWRRHKPR